MWVLHLSSYVKVSFSRRRLTWWCALKSVWKISNGPNVPMLCLHNWAHREKGVQLSEITEVVCWIIHLMWTDKHWPSSWFVLGWEGEAARPAVPGSRTAGETLHLHPQGFPAALCLRHLPRQACVVICTLLRQPLQGRPTITCHQHNLRSVLQT